MTKNFTELAESQDLSVCHCFDNWLSLTKYFIELAESQNLTQSHIADLIIGVMDYNQGTTNEADYEFLDGSTVPNFNQWDPSFVTGNSTKWCTKVNMTTGNWIQMVCNGTSDTDGGYPVCEQVPNVTYTWESFGGFFGRFSNMIM